jgi:hypothetical protein
MLGVNHSIVRLNDGNKERDTGFQQKVTSGYGNGRTNNSFGLLQNDQIIEDL